MDAGDEASLFDTSQGWNPNFGVSDDSSSEGLNVGSSE